MPVNTRDKRASAITLNTRMATLPTPGTITQPDRQHVARMYSGIAADGGVSPPLPSTGLLLPWVRRRRRSK